MLLNISPALARRLLAEFIGAAILAAVVIGSGIAAAQLSPGDVGLELFENAAATSAGLFAIIRVFGPISGAHLNPIVSVIDAIFGGMSWRDVAFYVPTQFAGCCVGAVATNLMFSRSAINLSTRDRTSGGHFLSEVLATIGLVLVVFILAKSGHVDRVPTSVAAYIGAAYFFTSSTSVANPAIAVGRMLSNSFAGISPSSVPPFVVAELVGGGIGALLLYALLPSFSDRHEPAVQRQ